ncbi:MAG: T9SS type A sorting domain-containing protein [Moheibacter sp.]
MKARLLTLVLALSLTGFAQNLLTNPSFEDYSGDMPTNWLTDEANAIIVVDATDGSVGVKMSKDTDYGGRDFRLATTQWINLEGRRLSMRFDYKVVSGEINDIGFIMLPTTWEFAANSDIVNDGEWHLNNYADMETPYIMPGDPDDYYNLQVFYGNGFPEAEVIIDNLAFGYVGTLGNTDYTDAISQDIQLGPNPTNSTITFFNVDKVSDKTVKVYDLTGKIVLKSELINDKLDLSSLPNGVYMLQLGDSFTKKVVKK